ncbi:MAG TPA: Ku protein [Gaiellaceae bacterium]|nr:Ku protein [Gaiellaceae bacterium]
MPARSIGTATIAFGLVSIPTKIYTTNETANDIHFNMLHDKDGGRLKQQYVCACCGEVVDREHTAKGYEHSKGQYVMFTADELKALDAVATQTIALEEFVPASEIDPLLVEKSYYLGPDKGGDRAYALIRDTLLKTGLVGIASYSARGKQYIVALRPYRDGLILHQLRYADEVKDWKEVPLPALPESKEAEIAMAQMLVEQLASQTFSPAKYKDEVQARMRDMIEKKIEGQEISMPAPVPAGQIVDLMAALKASLGPAAATAAPAAAATDSTNQQAEVPSRMPAKSAPAASRKASAKPKAG